MQPDRYWCSRYDYCYWRKKSKITISLYSGFNIGSRVHMNCISTKDRLKLWFCASWVERAKAQQRQRRAECYYKTINIKTTTILHFDIIFILFSILPLTIKFFEHSISSRMADPMRLHMLDYEMEMDAGKIYGKHLVWHHDNGSSVYSNERCLISIER